MQQKIKDHFFEQLPSSDFCSIRWVQLTESSLGVKKNRVDYVNSEQSQGVMVTVIKDGELGYGTT